MKDPVYAVPLVRSFFGLDLDSHVRSSDLSGGVSANARQHFRLSSSSRVTYPAPGDNRHSLSIHRCILGLHHVDFVSARYLDVLKIFYE